MGTVAKRDYYEVLGVTRDADAEAVERAFHALGREAHPDISDAPDADARFRELVEAHSVLSKREARLLYDRYGYRSRGNPDVVDEALWELRPRIARAEDFHAEIKIRSFEAARGTSKNVKYETIAPCTACKGRGAVGVPDPVCEYCGGTGRKRTLSHLDRMNLPEVEPCPVCLGKPCPRCGGTGRIEREHRIRLLVPPGVEDGTELRVTTDSDGAGTGAGAGDLLVRVRVLAPPDDPWLVRVRVLAPPDDPWLVRFVAFVLLIVAVVTLLVYLLHQ